MHKILAIVFLIFSNLLLAQKEVVEILSAGELKPGRSENHQKLVGNVILKYGDAKLFCDSSEVNGKTNDFNAWGNVFINQNNEIKAWGDSLIYKGSTKTGLLRGDVKMKNETSLLKTNALYFDRASNQVYYLNGANTTQDDSKIYSKKGFYNTNTKYLKLKDSVVINHPDYSIKADTLEYSTASKTSYFLGPTYIDLSEEKIYCEAGFYNRKLEIGQFEKNAIIKKDKQALLGDSIYIDKPNNLSKAYYNVELIDDNENLSVKGQEGYFDRNNNYSYITKDVLFAQGTGDDTLYMVCDTLLLVQENDSNQNFYAFRNVLLFQNEMQAKCDSLAYNYSDSLIKLFYDPVIWNGESQLTGDSIELLSYDNKLQKLYVKNNGFIVSLSDSLPVKYDQIKGRNLTGYFTKGKLSAMDVIGNGETIYYAKEEDGKYTGVNKAICSDIKIKFKNGKIDRIKFLTKPEATFYPIGDFPLEEQKLKGFIWKSDQRPSSLQDILAK